MTDFAVNAVAVLVVVVACLALLLLIAAPIEVVARRYPAFGDWLDRVIETGL